jgi:hypothetical protein
MMIVREMKRLNSVSIMFYHITVSVHGRLPPTNLALVGNQCFILSYCRDGRKRKPLDPRAPAGMAFA